MVEVVVYFPWYVNGALIVGFPILLFSFFVILGKKLHWDEEVTILSAIGSAFVGIIIAAIFIVLMGETKTYDNPIDALNSGYSTDEVEFNETALKNKIIKESDISQITLNKVNVGFWDDEDKPSKDLFEKFSNGDLVGFIGIKNGKTVEGNVYFTDDSVHITVNSVDDTKSQDEIIIPTN